MSSLLSIASNGVLAAQTGLDVTAQNIANVSTSGYVRRSVDQTELSTPETAGSTGYGTMSGVVVTGIDRDADASQQAEVRRTGSDAARADTLVTGLTSVDNSVEQSNVYSSITQFQSDLTELSSNPTNTSQRATVLADAQNMAQSFNLASQSLASATQDLQTAAGNGVTQLNTLATNLAQLNLKIATDTSPGGNQADLLDQRDAILGQMSQLSDVTTTIAANGTVAVRVGGASGPSLVSGGTASTMAMATASDGTVSFTVGGSAATLTGGSLVGNQQALATAATTKTSLDGIANSLITTVNTVQAGGADLNGNTGAAMFSGTGAGDIAVTMTSGSQIATAAAGSPAGSQDTSNLTALQNGLNTANVSGQTNSLIFNLSNTVASNTTTQTALDAISASAQATLSSQSGVSLDTEATNLLQYQQAFQASGKVIQVASTLFDQLLQIQ